MRRRGRRHTGTASGRAQRHNHAAICEEVTRRLTSLRTLVAKVDGRVVGYIAWSNSCRSHFSVDGAAEVGNLYVLREFQGRGVGRALLESALARIGDETSC